MRKRDYSKKKFEHPLKKQRKKFRLKKSLLVTIGAVFLLGLGFLALATPILAINQVGVTGTARVDIADTARAELNQIRDQKIIKIFPKNHLVWFKAAELEELLRQDIYIADVKLSKSFPKTLKVDIIERKPLVIYEFQGSKYLIDKQATIIEQARENNTPAGLSLIQSTSTDTLLGNIDEMKVGFAAIINEKFSEFMDDTIISHFLTGQESSELTAQTSLGWLILFDASVDPLVQLSNLSRTYKEKISNEEKGSLEYIDVRLENYVYYK